MDRGTLPELISVVLPGPVQGCMPGKVQKCPSANAVHCSGAVTDATCSVGTRLMGVDKHGRRGPEKAVDSDVAQGKIKAVVTPIR